MRKNTIRLTIAAATFAGSFLVLGSTKPTVEKPQEQEVPCKESLDECCLKKLEIKGGTDEMMRQTLSGQFFTFSGLD